MSISAQGIVKVFGSQRALDDVSFEVGKGEIVGLLGPNGAGKSTMMRIITGYIPPSQGRIEVCGMDAQRRETEVKMRLGYLPENNPLYPEMYVREYLSFCARLYRIPRPESRVKEMISLVGLEKEDRKRISALSKGYRQRVGLSQALIHSPVVLILDVATTGMDPNQIVEIRQLIKEIGKDKTVLLSTHIMQEVEAICDRAIIITNGRIVANSDIASLKKAGSASGKLIVRFSRPPDKSILTSRFESGTWEETADDKFEFTGDDMSGLKKKIMQFSIDFDLEITSMADGGDNLEEIFREMTRG